MARKYQVKEIFRTIQGEGTHAGVPSIFVRFAGCNAWNGKMEDRASSICPFCDTDFLDGEKMTAEDIVAAVEEAADGCEAIVVFTGGEPLLQLDAALAEAVSVRRALHVETNGLTAMKEGTLAWIDWVCMSPKGPPGVLKLQPEEVDEVKVLIPPQEDGMDPDGFLYWHGCGGWGPERFCLQPVAEDLDGISYEAAISKSLPVTMDEAFRLGVRVSLQGHKGGGVR